MLWEKPAGGPAGWAARAALAPPFLRVQGSWPQGVEGTLRGHLVHVHAATAVLKPQRDSRTCPFPLWLEPRGPLMRGAAAGPASAPGVCLPNAKCRPGRPQVRPHLQGAMGKSKEGLVPLRGSDPEREPACPRAGAGRG